MASKADKAEATDADEADEADLPNKKAVDVSEANNAEATEADKADLANKLNETEKAEADEANKTIVAGDANCAVLYSLTKFSAIFAEVKGYFGITAPDNQLGQRSSRSLRSWNKIDNQLDKSPLNGHYYQLKHVIGVSRHHNCRNVFDVIEQENRSHNF